MARARKQVEDQSEVERLKAQLEIETQARLEAERHAQQVESQTDLSRLNSVASEAQAVAQLSVKREPKVSLMPFGTTRIDF